MSQIANLVAQTVAPQVTAQLQPYLRGLFGGIVQRYLPQTWWFSTETGHATLVVDNQGHCQVYDGQAGQPDAAITWTDQAFSIVLTTRDRNRLPAARVNPTWKYTLPKGRRRSIS